MPRRRSDAGPVCFALFVLHLAGANEQTKTLQSPDIVYAFVGDIAKLHCHSSLNSDIDWKYQLTLTSEPKFVYCNGLVYDVYQSRFTVNKTSPYDYTLVIRDAQYSDSGLYVCIEDAGYGDRHVTQFNVTGMKPISKSGASVGLSIGLPVAFAFIIIVIAVSVTLTIKHGHGTVSVCCRRKRNPESIVNLLNNTNESSQDCCPSWFPRVHTTSEQTVCQPIEQKRKPDPVGPWNDGHLTEIIETEYELQETLSGSNVFKAYEVENFYHGKQNATEQILSALLEVPDKQDAFLKALELSFQSHVVNYINWIEKKGSRKDGDWPIEDEQMNNIEQVRRDFVSTMETTKEFLDKLRSLECITPNQHSVLGDMKKNNALTVEINRRLLRIIQKRSIAQYNSFMRCLKASFPDFACLFASHGGLIRTNSQFDSSHAKALRRIRKQSVKNNSFDVLRHVGPGIKVIILQQPQDSTETYTLEYVFVCPTLSTLEQIQALQQKPDEFRETIEECISELCQEAGLKTTPKPKNVIIPHPEDFESSKQYLGTAAVTRARFDAMKSDLRQNMYIEDGFLNSLMSGGALTEHEVTDISNQTTPYSMNELLLATLQNKSLKKRFKFLEALMTSGQQHVVNHIYVKALKDDKRRYVSQLPLAKGDASSLQVNYCQLVQSLDASKFEDLLTPSQATAVKNAKGKNKTRLLLDIIRFRSVSDFENFQSRVRKMNILEKWQTDRWPHKPLLHSAKRVRENNAKLQNLIDPDDDLLDKLHSGSALSHEEMLKIRAKDVTARRQLMREQFEEKTNDDWMILIEALKVSPNQKDAVQLIEQCREQQLKKTRLSGLSPKLRRKQRNADSQPNVTAV